MPKGAPHAASVDEADALRAAVRDLYPGRSVDARIIARSKNTTSFAKDGWYAAPTVERVALADDRDELAGGYVVTTWTADDNEFFETVVSGDGEVVETLRRTAEEKLQHRSRKTRTRASRPPVAGDFGWLRRGRPTRPSTSAATTSHAYLDTDADNKPDGGHPSMTAYSAPSSTRRSSRPSRRTANVSVQNLFYLNNVIHDTLYVAGFNEAAGNFQEDNVGLGGRGGDPVAAEAQDGSGTDNANFATPRDGQDPRMQMYLWSARHVRGRRARAGGITGSYDAANGEWADVTSPVTALARRRSTVAPRPPTGARRSRTTVAGKIAHRRPRHVHLHRQGPERTGLQAPPAWSWRTTPQVQRSRWAAQTAG